MCTSGQALGLGIYLLFSSCSRKRKGHISFISFSDVLTFFNAATLSQHFRVRGQGVSQTSAGLSGLHTGPVRALEMHITLEDKTVLLILWSNFFFSHYIFNFGNKYFKSNAASSTKIWSNHFPKFSHKMLKSHFTALFQVLALLIYGAAKWWSNTTHAAYHNQKV